MNLVNLGSNRWLAVMERSSARWYWYHGIRSFSRLLARTSENNARIFHVVPYEKKGREFWACIMIGSMDKNSESIFNYIFPRRTGGSFEFFMRQIKGPVYAEFMSTTVFEPASSIKALLHAHAMRKVQDGYDDLSNILIVPTSMSGSCPTSNAPFVSRSLETVLKRMMVYSDNADTLAIVERYGLTEINLSAEQLRMMQSRVAHRMGCGASSPGIIGQLDASNWLSLVDITRLYSKVATTWLTSKYRAKFFNLMGTFFAVYTVIDEEESKLSLPITSSTVSNFKAGVLANQKAGSYTVNRRFYKSIGAYVKLPRASCDGVMSHFEYVLGVFIDQATSEPADSTLFNTGAEMLREPIQTGLASFKSCA